MKLHQHRRLTRAQSHHGSEEEKKRRKILARKVGKSLPHLTITCWLVAGQFCKKTDYFKKAFNNFRSK